MTPPETPPRGATERRPTQFNEPRAMPTTGRGVTMTVMVHAEHGTVAVLTPSREPLGLQKGLAYELTPLPFRPHARPSSSLRRAPRCNLFVHRARSRRYGFHLDGADLQVVGDSPACQRPLSPDERPAGSGLMDS
jgi:hypothetical protein